MKRKAKISRKTKETSITVEVNMARLFNHNVKLKKQAEAAALKA